MTMWGVPASVKFMPNNEPLIYSPSGNWIEVPHTDGRKAMAAMLSEPPREVEILLGDGTWQTRTVRILPVVVVKARGRIVVFDWQFSYGGKMAHLRLRKIDDHADSAWFPVTNYADAAACLSTDAEVEIVSIDGGPDTVRRVL